MINKLIVKKLFSISIIISMAFNAFSGPPVIVLFNANGTQSAGAWSANARLKSLVSDLHPAVYLGDGEAKVREVKPVCLFTDGYSLDKIQDLTFARGQVEIITIEVNELADLNYRLNVGDLRGFSALHYVHVRCSVLCQPSQAFAMLTNIPQGVQVLVTVDEPS